MITLRETLISQSDYYIVQKCSGSEWQNKNCFKNYNKAVIYASGIPGNIRIDCLQLSSQIHVFVYLKNESEE